MKVQLNTDKNIEGTANLESYVSERLTQVLKHLADHVTRIEVHLSDQNADKSGPDDVLCKMEARIQNRQPVVVTSQSDSTHKALDAAADKLKGSLSSIIDKMRNR